MCTHPPLFFLDRWSAKICQKIWLKYAFSYDCKFYKLLGNLLGFCKSGDLPHAHTGSFHEDSSLKIIYSMPSKMLPDPAKKSATLSIKVIPLACRATVICIKDEVKCVMFWWEQAGLCWIREVVWGDVAEAQGSSHKDGGKWRETYHCGNQIRAWISWGKLQETHRDVRSIWEPRAVQGSWHPDMSTVFLLDLILKMC